MNIDSSKIDVIDKNNISLMGRTKTPGMVFGIVQNGKPAFIKGYGSAAWSNGSEVPVTDDSVFRIASISKLFTAIGIMKLVEQGLVSLDDPAEQHLRSFRIRKFKSTDPPITLRHLLTHTAGVGEFAPLLGYLQPRTLFGVSRKGRPLPPLAALYRGELRPDRSPGEAWAYANHGFATLGQVIADVTGDDFPEAMRKMIFRPLSMQRSDFVRSDAVMANQALGYYKFRDQDRPVLDLDIITLADGSLFTTANDFAKFLGELTMGGGTIISKSSLSKMMRPHFQLDKNLPAMGLGFFLENRRRWRDHLVASHSGLWLGFHSAVLLSPAHQVGTFAFANDGTKTAISAATNSLNTILPRNPVPASDSAAQLPKENWAKLVGTYRLPKGFNSNFRVNLRYGRKFTVYIDDGRLMIRSGLGEWRSGEPLRATPTSDPLHFLAGMNHIVFKCDQNEEIDHFCMRYHQIYKQ